MLKKCFELKCSCIDMADEENLIFDVDEGHRFVNINGNPVPVKAEYRLIYDNDDDDETNYEFVDDVELIPESTIEIDWEVYDGFGNYGYKNKEGEFVIEPQYAYAHDFTCGLAAVNLNRTWYRTPDGKRFYENHCGYINEKEKTVIPFIYDEAYPFNKYGAAVVDLTDKEGMLIDLNGEVIPGTDDLSFFHYYHYNERYFEFIYRKEEYDHDELEIRGLYDTKLRKIFLKPSTNSYYECDEDTIRVSEGYGKYGKRDFHEYYIDSNGEKIYDWLLDKEFAKVEKPNSSLLSIVGIPIYTELEGNQSSNYSCDGKNFDRDIVYGVYSSSGRFELPADCELIKEIHENIFACSKNGIISIFKYE